MTHRDAPSRFKWDFCSDRRRPTAQRLDAAAASTMWTWVRVLTAARSSLVLVWRLGTGPFLEGVRAVDALVTGGGRRDRGGDDGVLRLAVAPGRAGLGVGCRCRRRSRRTTGRSFSTRCCPAACSATCTGRCATAATSVMSGLGVRAVVLGTLGRPGGAGGAGRGRALALPSPVRDAMPVIAGDGCGWSWLASYVLRRPWVALCLPLGHRGGREVCARRSRHPRRACSRGGYGPASCSRPRWCGGHLATFLIAARTAGSTASPARLLPLALARRCWPWRCRLNVGRVGPPRGHGGVGVRCGRADRGPGRRHSGGVRRDGARGQPARGRGAAVRRLGARSEEPALAQGEAMAERPYTLLSCSMSIDGYLGGATDGALCCCPTTPTSTGWTPCAQHATRSSSARAPSAETIRGCSCGPRPAGTSGWPGGCRPRRSR